ncbi:DUF3558 domain-containing protein [Streptomyces sp. DT24]|uniref:DUF3558 domain-containing protein n=1 Tax=Streptomyces sp. DT24 TaxID=3416520 RepID=UPI003CF68A23
MAYVPGVALVAALVVGCTAGSGTDGSAADSKPGSPTVSAAPPGKYRTLPSACRSVARDTLRDLLPGIAQLPEQQQEQAYGGTPAVTYDTDRRVGCRWSSEATDASHKLVLDYERVVSYDPAVSDDDRADAVYEQKKAAARLPAATSTGASTGATTGTRSSPPASSTSPGSGGTDGGTDLRPRVLDDLGDAAFLDDQLTPAGSTAQHRTVSVVFRTSNVVVTVQYTEQPAFTSVVPDSAELQEKTQALARKLAQRISE